MRRFNTTGLCIPYKHYMVDIKDKLDRIKKLIDDGEYFVINRARQYGKTTTLFLLEQALADEYLPLSISFEGIDESGFASPEAFCISFMDNVEAALASINASQALIDKWKSGTPANFQQLGKHLSALCKDKRLVLLIDEVDKICNNEVFLHFLGMLRDKYLKQSAGKDCSFYSVVLAGVTDIKNIKLAMIQKGLHEVRDGERIYNSPWNIAADFDVDMSFDPTEISSMLSAYEDDQHIGMDINTISDAIYSYTSGYPFLVSYICKIIDERLDKNWTAYGVKEAVKIILETPSTLLDDLGKNLESNVDIYNLLHDILIKGETIQYQFSDPATSFASMYGIVINKEGRVNVSNRIFELFIYNHFISKDRRLNTPKVSGVLAYDVIDNGRFNMRLCLERFAKHFYETFTAADTKFLEQNVRQVFLTYLKPLINGQGFYHIESQLLDQRRMDIVIDYGTDQFILELKIWRGEQRRSQAYEQLAGYLESKAANEGYLLTFDFRKEQGKEQRNEMKAKWVVIGNKRIFDIVVKVPTDKSQIDKS